MSLVVIYLILFLKASDACINSYIKVMKAHIKVYGFRVLNKEQTHEGQGILLHLFYQF